ncbi:MAG: CoA transferase [Solirubrobacteraceae bacterium]|nr:CoA transferase [Solirubrobacteraceae bacterium]
MTALPPLHGLRILDASRLLPGPAATRILADLGADVVRVDHPDVVRGDLTRMTPPFAVTTTEGAPVDDAQGFAFIALNHGKRSVAIDLREPAGVERFLGLASEADVVLESFRPGTLDRLGAGWDAIHAVNPATILCSITGYGQHGPSAAQAGHDIGYLARAGVLGHSGEPDRPPLPLGVQVADLAGGALPAVVGILAALRERDGAPGAPGSGLGQHVDVSMTDASRALFQLDGAAVMAGHEAARGAAPLGGAAIACYRTYACSDGHVTLGALEPKFWRAFCAGLGRDDLLAHPGASPASPEGREIESIFATRTRHEWAAFAAEHDCCLEAVLTPAEAFAAARAAAEQGAMPATLAVPTTDGGTIDAPAPGVRFSRSPLAEPAAAPRTGEHDALPSPWITATNPEALA